MACPDLQTETEFFQMLDGVDGYSIKDNKLSFLSKNKVVAVFKKAEEGKTIGELLSLIDVSWLDISVADKRNSLPDEIFPGIEDCADQEGLKVGG